jgi:N utilization substance protein A
MAMAGISANRLELLQIADAVAREKTIDRSIVIEAMEDAIQKAAKSRYGAENDIRCKIDVKTGEANLARVLSVVETIENDSTEITLEDAISRNPDAKVGDLIAEPLPPLDFGRVAAQNAKQVIVQKVREAERERHYSEYKDRISEIVNGTVKRVEYGNVIVDLGRAEGVIRRDEMIPRENVRYGDRVRSYIYDVRREPRGPQIFLSRARPEFMSKLFAQEVPEIYDGVVEIKSVARDPGSRAKLAVISRDSSIDPVGACVGMRGSRVQAVVNELQGEKVDIIQWNEDAASFIVNALAPAEVTKVVLDEDSNRIEVVVPESQLSLAIGRRGQNVRLASQLTGWDIDIMTEQEESERRQKEFAERSQILMETLDVDEVIAQLLVTEGFASVEEVAYVDVSEIAHIEGFDEDTGNEIQTRAREYLEKQESDRDAKRRELGVADDLAKIQGVTTAMMVVFGENEIKTVEDVAGCATDDLIGWTERKREKDAEVIRHKGILDSFEIGRTEAEEMIMSARVLAGWIKQEDLEPEPEAEGAEGEAAEGEAAEGEAEEESATAEAPQAEEGESSASEVEGGKSSAAEG